MRLPTLKMTGTGLAAATGGGLASVLLSMITLQHPPLTVVMGFIAPLPIMIAALGFGSGAGLLSIAVGAIFIGLFDLKAGTLAISQLDHLDAALLDVLVFVVALAVPALVLSRLAARPVDPIAKDWGGLRPEERHLAVVVLAAAVFATITVCLVFGIAIWTSGSLAAFETTMIKELEKIWQTIAASRPLPEGLDVHKFAVQLTWLLPPLMASGLVVFYVFNLWLAGRTAQASSLLAAPWPDIPRYLRLPRAMAFLLAVSLGLSFLTGMVGLAARIVSAVLISCFALQGLAVVHETTRGKSVRLPLLIIVYLTMMALFPWPFVFWGFFGLLDTAFSFRDRHQAPDDKPGPWGPTNKTKGPNPWK